MFFSVNVSYIKEGDTAFQRVTELVVMTQELLVVPHVSTCEGRPSKRVT